MKFKQELIDKLRRGHICVRNEDKELTEQIIKTAFPTSKSCGHVFTEVYYYKSPFFEEDWAWARTIPNLPVKSVKDFLVKEIIGYKLIKPEYNSVAIDITDMKNKHWEGFIKDDFYKNNSLCRNYDNYVEKLKAAGVLDIWFEPVYEEEFKLPKINGYEGSLKNNKLAYGCAHLSKKWFNSSDNRHIKSMVLSSGVEINEEQMNQIRKYLNKNQ